MAVLLVSVSHGVAAAQHVRVTVENDAIALRERLRAEDRDYSSGLRLEWLRGDRLRVAIGQEIYTPRIDDARPVPGERPYAALLYGEVGMAAAATDTRGPQGFSIAVGVVGPGAFGEPIQNGIHELTGMATEEGWDRQLRLGAIVQARYRDGLRIPLSADSRVTVGPFTEFTVGSLRLATTAGTALHLGSGAAESVPYGRGFGASLSAAAVWKPWDALLDSDSWFTDTLDRRRVFARFESAVGYRMSHWTISYRLVVVGREYPSQPGSHAYGSLSLAWHPER